MNAADKRLEICELKFSADESKTLNFIARIELPSFKKTMHDIRFHIGRIAYYQDFRGFPLPYEMHRFEADLLKEFCDAICERLADQLLYMPSYEKQALELYDKLTDIIRKLS
jgi:hypothetical protein